jgi:hypothetical protein
MLLSHSVLVVLVYCAQLAAEVDLDTEVHVPLVPVVGDHLEGASDLLTLLAGQVVIQVEHSLLPVSVWSFRGCGESNSLVAVSKLNVEESHKCLDVVIALELDHEV